MKGNATTRFLVAAATALFGFILVLHEARTPPESRLAPPDRLVQVFEKIVFYTEDVREFHFVEKWSQAQPVLLYLEGDVRPEFRRDVLNQAEKLSRATALSFQITETLKLDSRVALARIYFGPEQNLRKIARQRIGNSNFLNRNLVCMASHDANSEGIIRRSFIYISIDRPRDRYLSCLLEEMTQSLGLPNDVDLLLPTIFSDKSAPLDLTLTDRLLVRTLYDDRLYPGMPRAEAMVMARQVINELHAAVRARGPDALIHPRHAARQAR
jgi:hypothetical protein